MKTMGGIQKCFCPHKQILVEFPFDFSPYPASFTALEGLKSQVLEGCLSLFGGMDLNACSWRENVLKSKFLVSFAQCLQQH